MLLLMTTSWSHASAAMLHTTYADALVSACVEEHFVPVHVDADLRPDIGERYALDGWPATVLLTPGGDTLAGVHLLDPARLCEWLGRAATLARDHRAEIDVRAAAGRRTRQPAPPLTPEAPDARLVQKIAGAIMARADVMHGGFRDEPKRLDGDALLFLIRYAAVAEDTDAATHVQRTLDRLDASPLVQEDGLLARCALGNSWDQVSSDCDLATQVAGLRVFAEAAAAYRSERYLARARALASRLWNGWRERGSQEERHLPGQAPAMWHAPSGAGSPATTDLMAELASSRLAAAVVLEDPDLAAAAVSALEQSVLSTYRPGQGVLHSTVPDAPRLLSDHVHVVAALLDAHAVTGEAPYAMLAEELGRFAISAFFDADAGALRDRVHDDGDLARLAEPWHPFRANAAAISAWRRLAVTAGEPEFEAVAARALSWAAGCWRRQGLQAAACGLAALDLIDWRPS